MDGTSAPAAFGTVEISASQTDVRRANGSCVDGKSCAVEGQVALASGSVRRGELGALWEGTT